MKPLHIRTKLNSVMMMILLVSLLPFYRAPAPAGAATAANDASAAFNRFWITKSNNTEGPSTAVDDQGGIHVAFSSYTAAPGGGYPAYYAYCPASCSSQASWSVVALNNLGMFGGYTRVAVDASGRPRLLWYQKFDLGTDGVYWYAECNSACTVAENWKMVSLAVATVGPEIARYFALDPEGRPRFLYIDSDSGHEGAFYAFCDANCTVLQNWYEEKISNSSDLYDFSMAFSPSGGVRIAFKNATTYPDKLQYAECDTNCGDEANWTSTVLVEDLGSGGYLSLAVDSQGRPRLAYFTGYYGSNEPANYLLNYAWCNASCGMLASWTIRSANLPANYGKYVDLAVDATGRLHMAFYIDDFDGGTEGLGYMVCTANCYTDAAIWERQMIEYPADLDASDPIPLVNPCTLSAWLDVGMEPSLALDAAGNPRITYMASHYQGGLCNIFEDIRLVRFTMSGTTSPNLEYKVYLPYLMK